MARLASEHHPQGPGDAPRRRKGRKSTPADDLVHGSKRAASPSVEPSQSKRKRVQVDDHDQLAREMEDSASRSQPHVTETVDVAVTTETRTRRSRRHSEPTVAAEDDEDDGHTTPPPSTEPLSGLTPHLARLGAPRGRPSNARRARMSMPAQVRVEPVDENDGDHEFQFAPMKAVIDGRTRRRLRRNHISQEVNEIVDHEKEDKKLRKAYAELRTQLRAKDHAISELEYQIEAGRLGNIDMSNDHAEALQLQLSQAKDEINELRASSIYNGDDARDFDANMDDVDEEEEGLTLIDPNDDGGPQEVVEAQPLPNGEYATRALQLSSQVTVKSLAAFSQTSFDVLADGSESGTPTHDNISSRAVKRYESEIERLIQQLAESQGALRVIAVELQNLHVVHPGASSDVIVESLRNGFQSVREELENLLPGRTVGLTNSELLHKIPELFENVLKELREKVLVSEKHYQNENILRAQYENVLDLLSRSEERNNELDQQVDSLERSTTVQLRSIGELEERVTTLDALVDEQDAGLKEKTVEISGLNDEVQDKDTASDRLRASLETYRIDLDTVTATATRLEEEHSQTMADMEQAHADIVLDLQTQLGEETEARAQAEGNAEQKSEYIEELEDRIRHIESEINLIVEAMTQLQQRLAEETELRLTAEGERDQETETVYTQANSIENMTETVQDLEAQLADFRTNLETERAQREQTEAALEDATAQITDLNVRIHDAGLQANELRSKLFQAQQEREQAVADLQEEALDAAAANQELVDAEAERRAIAETGVATLQGQVTQLENTIVVLEEGIVQMTQSRADLELDRDERVATLSAQLAELQQKYVALENTTSSEITALQASITDLTNEVNAQRLEIERISEEAAETQRILQDELAEKNEQIETLNGDLVQARTNNDNLVKENTSLAERVAEEAEELLITQDSHGQERDALRKVISDQESTITNLQTAAAQRATEHEEAVVEKSAEIQELRVMGDVRAEHIAELEAQVEQMKEAFRAAEEDTRATIDTLTESQRVLQQQNEHLADALKKRNADALKAVQEMKVKGVAVHTKGVDLHKVANGKVSKVSERVKIGKKSGGKKKVSRRQWDSGFGFDEEIEGEGEADGEEAVPA